MTIYPDIEQSRADYRRELERHLDDPMRLAIFQACWLGTRQYQHVIERAGLQETQRLLAAISAAIGKTKRRFVELNAIEAAAATTIKSTPDDLRRLREPDFRRDTVTRRLVPINNTEKIVARIAACEAAQRREAAAAAEADSLRQNLDAWRSAEARLRSAIYMYATSSRVEAASQDNQPLHVVVDALPTRRRVSEIDYDSNGDIISTIQIESDA